MTYADVVTRAKRLSKTEKLALIKELADSLREEGTAPKRKSTLKSLYGAVRLKDGPGPTNEELKEDYIKHLVEKSQ
jgi:hypothetical protein